MTTLRRLRVSSGVKQTTLRRLRVSSGAGLWSGSVVCSIPEERSVTKGCDLGGHESVT